MGTFGALYYGGSLFSPHAILVGKPIVNLGDVAANLKFKRPDEFGTSLDMMQLIIGQSVARRDRSAESTLLGPVWSSGFQGYNFSPCLYEGWWLRPAGLSRYFRGSVWIAGSWLSSTSRAGRHNDASGPIIEWLLTQYKEIMEETLEETNDKNKENESRRIYWGDTVLADYLWGRPFKRLTKEAFSFRTPHAIWSRLKTWHSQTNFGATRQILVCPCSKESKIMNWLSRWKRLPAHTVMVEIVFRDRFGEVVDDVK